MNLCSEPSQETIKDNIDRVLNGDLTVSTIIEEPKIPLNSSNTVESVKIINNNSENFNCGGNERVFESLKNTQLPMRSKMSEKDPFRFLLGSNYLIHFLLASSVVIFGIGLFN